MTPEATGLTGYPKGVAVVGPQWLTGVRVCAKDASHELSSGHQVKLPAPGPAA